MAYTSLMRSINAKKQLRDRKGRWVDQGGSIKALFAGVWRSAKVRDIKDNKFIVDLDEPYNGVTTTAISPKNVEGIPSKARLARRAQTTKQVKATVNPTFNEPKVRQKLKDQGASDKQVDDILKKDWNDIKADPDLMSVVQNDNDPYAEGALKGRKQEVLNTNSRVGVSDQGDLNVRIDDEDFVSHTDLEEGDEIFDPSAFPNGIPDEPGNYTVNDETITISSFKQNSNGEITLEGTDNEGNEVSIQLEDDDPIIRVPAELLDDSTLPSAADEDLPSQDEQSAAFDAATENAPEGARLVSNNGDYYERSEGQWQRHSEDGEAQGEPQTTEQVKVEVLNSEDIWSYDESQDDDVEPANLDDSAEQTEAPAQVQTETSTELDAANAPIGTEVSASQEDMPLSFRKTAKNRWAEYEDGSPTGERYSDDDMQSIFDEEEYDTVTTPISQATTTDGPVDEAPSVSEGDSNGSNTGAEGTDSEVSGDSSGGSDGPDGPVSGNNQSLEPHGRESAIQADGGSTPNLYETQDAAAFRAAISQATEGPYGAAVYVYDQDEYAGMRMFMNESQTAGFALKDDEIVSVFSLPTSPDKKVGRHLIAHAVDQGGRRLDAFDTVLPHIYAKEGFKPVARVKWDDEYAPEGWNYDTFSAFNNGRPDVVAMAYDKDRLGSTYNSEEGSYYDDYDEAIEATKKATTDSYEAVENAIPKGAILGVQTSPGPNSSTDYSTLVALGNGKSVSRYDGSIYKEDGVWKAKGPNDQEPPFAQAATKKEIQAAMKQHLNERNKPVLAPDAEPSIYLKSEDDFNKLPVGGTVNLASKKWKKINDTDLARVVPKEVEDKIKAGQTPDGTEVEPVENHRSFSYFSGNGIALRVDDNPENRALRSDNPEFDKLFNDRNLLNGVQATIPDSDEPVTIKDITRDNMGNTRINYEKADGTIDSADFLGDAQPNEFFTPLNDADKAKLDQVSSNETESTSSESDQSDEADAGTAPSVDEPQTQSSENEQVDQDWSTGKNPAGHTEQTKTQNNKKATVTENPDGDYNWSVQDDDGNTIANGKSKSAADARSKADQASEEPEEDDTAPTESEELPPVGESIEHNEKEIEHTGDDEWVDPEKPEKVGEANKGTEENPWTDDEMQSIEQFDTDLSEAKEGAHPLDAFPDLVRHKPEALEGEKYPPNQEQQDAIDAVLYGLDTKIIANAGSGKTSTLVALAKRVKDQSPEKKILYLVFNKSAQKDAQKRMPDNVQVVTGHALALQNSSADVKSRWEKNKNPDRITTYNDIANHFGITGVEGMKDKKKLAKLSRETVKNFTKSGDKEINESHVPLDSEGMNEAAADAIRALAVGHAQNMWNDINSPDGKLRLVHDDYRKIFALNDPDFSEITGATLLMVDEMQDTATVLGDMVDSQNIQKVLVGDPNQAINCQPVGTSVLVPVGKYGPGQPLEVQEVPIETLSVGDKVSTFFNTNVYKTGKNITDITRFTYSGDLVQITTESGMTSQYTPNHYVIVRGSENLYSKYITYLMRKGRQFRIGKTKMILDTQDRGMGIALRTKAEGADSAWILGVHDTESDALLHEALLWTQYGIPGMRFRHTSNPYKNSVSLEAFWESVGDNTHLAKSVLEDFGLLYDHPFVDREKRIGRGTGLQAPIVTAAANIISGMSVLPFKNAKLWKNKRSLVAPRGSWETVSVSRTQYTGDIISLTVEDHHTYFGDGILTHNSFAGAVDYITTAKADVSLPLTTSYRFGKNIADWGNRALQMLGSKQRVVGGGKDDGEVRTDFPEDFNYKAILTRTNLFAIDHIMDELAKGKKVGLPPKMRDDLVNLARTVGWMKGEPGMWEPKEKHGDLAEYDSWGDVLKEAAGEGGDLTAKKIAGIFDMDNERYNQMGIYSIKDMIPHLQKLVDPDDVDPFNGARVNPDTGRILWDDGEDRGWQMRVAIAAKLVNLSTADTAAVMGKDSTNYGLKKKIGILLKQEGFLTKKDSDGWYNAVPGNTPEARENYLKHLENLAAVENVEPDITISTAHKSKGLEWESVLIAEDFALKTDKNTGEVQLPDDDEYRLAYVALTRAEKQLNPGGLAWLEDYTEKNGGDPNVEKYFDEPDGPSGDSLDDIDDFVKSLKDAKQRQVERDEHFENADDDPVVSESPDIDDLADDDEPQPDMADVIDEASPGSTITNDETGETSEFDGDNWVSDDGETITPSEMKEKVANEEFDDLEVDDTGSDAIEPEEQDYSPNNPELDSLIDSNIDGAEGGDRYEHSDGTEYIKNAKEGWHRAVGGAWESDLSDDELKQLVKNDLESFKFTPSTTNPDEDDDEVVDDVPVQSKVYLTNNPEKTYTNNGDGTYTADWLPEDSAHKTISEDMLNMLAEHNDASVSPVDQPEDTAPETEVSGINTPDEDATEEEPPAADDYAYLDNAPEGAHAIVLSGETVSSYRKADNTPYGPWKDSADNNVYVADFYDPESGDDPPALITNTTEAQSWLNSEAGNLFYFDDNEYSKNADGTWDDTYNDVDSVSAEALARHLLGGDPFWRSEETQEQAVIAPDGWDDLTSENYHFSKTYPDKGTTIDVYQDEDGVWHADVMDSDDMTIGGLLDSETFDNIDEAVQYAEAAPALDNDSEVSNTDAEEIVNELVDTITSADPDDVTPESGFSIGDIVVSTKNKPAKVLQVQNGKNGTKLKVQYADGQISYMQPHLTNQASNDQATQYDEIALDNALGSGENSLYGIKTDANGNNYVTSANGDQIYVGDTVSSTGATAITGEVVGFSNDGTSVKIKDSADGTVKPRKLTKVVKEEQNDPFIQSLLDLGKEESTPTPTPTSNAEIGTTITINPPGESSHTVKKVGDDEWVDNDENYYTDAGVASDVDYALDEFGPNSVTTVSPTPTVLSDPEPLAPWEAELLGIAQPALPESKKVYTSKDIENAPDGSSVSSGVVSWVKTGYDLWNIDGNTQLSGIPNHVIANMLNMDDADWKLSTPEVPEVPGGIKNRADFQTKGDSMGGTNSGSVATYKPTGEEYYIKPAQSTDHAHVEVLSGQIYEALGIKTASYEYMEQPDGSVGVASKMFQNGGAADWWANVDNPSIVKKMQEGFAADALLANWDVMGTKPTANTLIDTDGNPIRLDFGGTLQYRAQGNLKPNFGTDVPEWYTLRDPWASNAATLYSGMTDAELKDSARKLFALTDNKIAEILASNSSMTASDRAKYRDLLSGRRDSVITYAGLADEWDAHKAKNSNLRTPKPDSVPGKNGEALSVGSKVIWENKNVPGTVVALNKSTNSIQMRLADGTKKWYKANKMVLSPDQPVPGAPKPQMPTLVDIPKQSFYTPGMLDKMRERFKKFQLDNGKSEGQLKTLEGSYNWSAINSYGETGDLSSLDSIKNKGYIDEDMYNELLQFRDIIQESNKSATETNAALMAEYKQAIKDWAAANGGHKSPMSLISPVATKDNEWTEETGYTVDADGNKIVDWSKAPAGTLSLQDALSDLDKDLDIGTHGLSVSVDSSDILDMNIRLFKVEDENGVLRTKINLTVHESAADKVKKAMEHISSPTEQDKQDYAGYSDAHPTLPKIGPGTATWGKSANKHHFMNKDVQVWKKTTEDGVELRMRSYDTDNYHKGSDNVSVMHNYIDALLPEDATPQHIENILKELGVEKPHPADPDAVDFHKKKAIANTLGAFVGDTSSKYENDKSVLDYDADIVLSKYNATIDDVELALTPAGFNEFKVSDNLLSTLLEEKKNLGSVAHAFASGDSDWFKSSEDPKKINYLLRRLTAGQKGVMGIKDRFFENDASSGSSWEDDFVIGGGKFLFMRTHQKGQQPQPAHSDSSYNSITVVAKPDVVFQYLGNWANTGDHWGSRQNGTSLMSNLPYSGNEFMLKHGLAVEQMWYMVMPTKAQKAAIIEALEEQGILEINGIPLDEFFVGPGDKAPTA